MNVGELIEALSKYPKEAAVFHCESYNSGCYGVKLSSFVTITGKVIRIYIEPDK